MYFKDQPEYQRVFEAMRKKWESLGRTAGKVTLVKGTEEERKALERFLGRPMEKEGLTFSLPEFENALGETRYGGVSLKELLEEYFGEPMVGNQERRQERKNREREFWDKLEREAGRLEEEKPAGETENEAVYEVTASQTQAQAAAREAVNWIRAMREQKSNGYTVVMKEYRISEESAKELVRQVVMCLKLCGRLWDGQTQDRKSVV